jgi:hypothetical protein
MYICVCVCTNKIHKSTKRLFFFPVFFFPSFNFFLPARVNLINYFIADPGGRAVYGVGLKPPLYSWNRGFESRWWHGYLLFVFYLGSDFRDDLVTRPGGCTCLIVCDIDTSQRGGWFELWHHRWRVNLLVYFYCYTVRSSEFKSTDFRHLSLCALIDRPTTNVRGPLLPLSQVSSHSPEESGCQLLRKCCHTSNKQLDSFAFQKMLTVARA